MSENPNTTLSLGNLLVTLAEAPETADKFDSWVGEGPNEPISGNEIAAQIAPETLTVLAEKAGASEAEVAASLAHEIPLLVDAIPAESILRFRSVAQDDFVAETAQLTKQQTLQQASTSVLAQANQLPSAVLKLLH
ncbi:YidB family protein [Streptomyces xanthophaeus]|uniref:YidB family protein n=1 Tax=Streptomyces xanthophaeus TaxID=67385 RepID=UPI003436347F